MAFTYYFYSPHSVDELRAIVEKTEDVFEETLQSLEDHPYLKEQEKLLSTLANVIPGPVLSELTFDDFAVEEGRMGEMQELWGQAKSCLCLEQVPYLSVNPFQVTWLKILIENLKQAMVDTGSVITVKTLSELQNELKKYRDLDMVTATIHNPQPVMVKSKPFMPVEPLDFILRDIYKEMERLSQEERLDRIEALIEGSEKLKKLFVVTKNNFQNGPVNSLTLLQKSGLHPKDFGDFLERLKFLLKRS